MTSWLPKVLAGILFSIDDAANVPYNHEWFQMILSIDQSTSATKAIVFSEQGELLAKASREHAQLYPKPGWVEHDAEEIWQNLLSIVRELAEGNSELWSAVKSVSITNQRETVVAFDRQTGKPLGRAIVWQCRRGAEICEDLADEGHADYVQATTGLKLDTYFSASKLKWIVDNCPMIAERLHAGTALVGTIETYLIYRLTQQEVFASDTTNACRTLLFDIHKMQWDQTLCRMFSVPMSALPEVRDPMGEFGMTDLEGLFSTPVPIRGVMGDSQASLFALGCHEPGDAKVTLGSGSSMLLNVGKVIPETKGSTVATIAWSYQNQPIYCMEGIINYSAATIEWLKNQLGLIESAAQAADVAWSVPDNGGVYLVPAFAGLSAPHWQPNARAAILGMSAHSNRAHIVRAGLESIAYQLRDALEMMREETGVSPVRIHADGGATANQFLMQFAADILQVPLQTSRVAESSPLGACFAGLVAGGVASLSEVADRSKVSQLFQPAMPPEQAIRWYSGWKQAVQRVL